MTYMILWRAHDQPSLFEKEEFESRSEAEAALADFHIKFPWNTYLMVRIEKAERGTGEPPGKIKITYLPAD